ncbi:unnamed protein product [Hymenolepis diminuta]|uniref:TRAPPC10/Trs130 N-terminal domain-containing protein n=2 Tax=Hymenolepis diminuta TaxID=6216 RepID=A0A564Y4V8_HYMDI|nr:unnamed protein product [Hymenolepis diminuta]
MNLENRPIIYYYGDDSATEHVKEFQSSVFSAEPVQWSRRSRDPPQSVHVDPNFMPLNIFPHESNGLITPSSHPAVYIFLCPNDPDYYSNKGKQAFGHWISFITNINIKEWLVIIITDKSKRVSFRNSIMTRLKHDFSIDFTDHLQELPSDYDSLPGTLQILNTKLRSAVIRVFNSTLDEMDQKSAFLLQSCHEKDWDFMEYYQCLEEMSSLYSCMSLYDEALECMEKADSCLTSELSETPQKGITKWIKCLLSNSCDRLITDPIIISTYANPVRVESVRQKKANLFELRAHILTRECSLLQALDRISELPQRAVRMIRLCTKEARDLKIPIPAFQLYFWIFLTSLQTLDIFRRGTRCAPKTEDFINLRRKFLHISDLLQQPPAVPNENSSAINNNSTLMSTDEDSNFPSNGSDLTASTLLSARFKALESLDLLEDVSLQTEGTFNILARAVLASVVADDHAKCGRGATQNQDLVGTSRWTVDLWRRACVALSRLGRYANLWPDPARRMTRGIRPDSLNGAMLISIMDIFNNSASDNADASSNGRMSFGGSFGAQLSIAFVSSTSFEESYRKFAGACIFFQSCSGAKRAAICMSLELADFYRDGGNFLKAEALYHQATKIFLKESWMELATYSLLQQAFCQQVQWRTENVDSIEASVFRRYVQTALILAITPSSNLKLCYELLKRRGAYFDNLFGEGAIASDWSSPEKVTILPPWWPEDWWAHALETVAEHYARIIPQGVTPMSPENLPLHRPLVPLSVRSLWPLFRLHALDLGEANPHTHRQVIRLHLQLIGVRPILVKVSVGGRPTTTEDWNEPPLSRCYDSKQGSDSMRFFNVDLNSEAIRSGIIAVNSDSSFTSSKELGESVSQRQSTGDQNTAPSPTSVPNSSFLGLSGSRDSVIQRLFRRSSAGGRTGRQFFRRSAVNATDTNGEIRTVKRPTSIDFLSFRGRLNTLDKITPLPSDSLLDGLTLSADDDRKIFNAGNSSVQEESNFSDGALIRQHKKGFSLSDFSAFAQSFRPSRTDISTKNNGEEEVNGHNGGVKITKATALDKENVIVFSPRCLSTNPFHCKLPENAKKLVEEEESAMTFHPGDNFLLMETSACGFHLPTEIKISLYNDEESAKLNTPCFVFSSSIIAEHFTTTWSSEPLLERLLPRVEQIEALRLSNAYKVPQIQHKGASAVVMCSMNQPVFLTVRVGDLSIEHSDSSITDRKGLGSDYGSDVRIRLRKTPTDQNTRTEPVWSQRYTVDPLKGEDKNRETTSLSDLGELVLAPGEEPQTSSNEYHPGTRLCPLQSFLLRPKLDEQISIILPTGRPYPIHLLPVGVLIFNAKVSMFHKKNLLVQLRVGVRDSTWPVLGSVNEKDKYSHFNPFYSQERIAFRFSSPKLELKPFTDSQPPASQTQSSLSSTTQPPTLATPATGHLNIRPPYYLNAQRSVSVVEFAPPSPAMLAVAASALGKSVATENISQNHKEIGHSFFFSKDEESGSTGSADKESSVEFTAEDPIQLVESPDYEGVVSYGRPLTVAWSVQLSHFNKNLRPTSKADGVGVIANFSFLVGSKYDPVQPRVHYSCNLVKKH